MSLVFENIFHSYGDITVLKGVSLTAHSGEILCLLGPSGCGKTTLLNLAAGVLKPQDGNITLDGKSLASSQNYIPPEKRPVGLVFQDGALFPHLTVEDNIEFGVSKQSDRHDISSKLLDQIGLSDLKKRFPHSLSGGQQQRVAVARSLAPNPRVVLLDEPFANIDIILRRRLREEIRDILKNHNCITIIVTHDPEEAMEISDKVAVMLGGDIAQFGRPQDVYENPISPDVAKLTSVGEIIPAVLNDTILQTEFGDWPIDSVRSYHADLMNGKLNVFIRPFAMNIKRGRADKFALKVTDVRHIGAAQIIGVSNSVGSCLNLRIATDTNWEVGQWVNLYPNKGALLAFPA